MINNYSNYIEKCYTIPIFFSVLYDKNARRLKNRYLSRRIGNPTTLFKLIYLYIGRFVTLYFNDPDFAYNLNKHFKISIKSHVYLYIVSPAKHGRHLGITFFCPASVRPSVCPSHFFVTLFRHTFK